MKKLWKFMKAVVFVVIIFVVLICAIGMKQKHRKQKNSTYIWPDNALTAMIPKPESKKGEVTFETEDTFSIDVYKTSKKEYNNYVNDCKKKGFTENYYGTDDHYSADHADGFSLRLSYNSTDKEMSIRISKKSETTTVNSTDTEESVAEDVEADNSDKTEAEETTETEEAAETDSSAESEDDLRILFDQAVEDAMIAEDGEILPVVSLDEGEPYAVYNEEGRVLLYTFHKYPDSYPDGTDVKLEWGNVWTFTGGELEDWYQENKEGVTDWQTRMKELLGLTPDNESNYVTAMWVKPEDVFRPAYISDIGTVEMTDSFSEDVDADYKAWFDANIISSYYDGEYPWTRLGYTYDWADNGQAYGLSEFIVKQDSDVKVAYTVELGEMIQKLEDNTWNPEAEN